MRESRSEPDETEPQREPDETPRSRYSDLDLDERGTLVYDRENPDAWIQSDGARDRDAIV